MKQAGGSTFRSVTLPFIIFTAIWGSTWIVIRSQLGPVPPQWSVTYRFVVAAIAMAAIAAWKGESLRIGRNGAAAAELPPLLPLDKVAQLPQVTVWLT